MSSTALITILDHLGGPRLTEEDVNWIEDLPAGRSLLEFLASLVAKGTVGLRDIALEKEEAEMWHKALQANLVVEPPSSTLADDATLMRSASHYLLPSELRSQLTKIDEEQSLLDTQLKVLNNRIAKARSFTKAGKRLDKTVSAARDQTSQSTLRLEEQLSELSLKADSTVSSAVQCASELVQELSVDYEHGQHSYQHVKELSMLLQAFSEISSHLARLSALHFQTKLNDPLGNTRVGVLRSETQRLARSIRELEAQHIAGAVEEECERLEKGGSLATMHTNPGEHDRTNIVEDDQWVETVVAQAWSREQVADLRRKTDGLQQIIGLLMDELLPSLALVHSSLSISEASVEETIVAIQALVDEMDDIAADLDVDKGFDTNTPASTGLEERIKDLLKTLRGLRPADLSSLVLVERQDVLSELSNVRDRYDCANAEVTTLCSAISPELLSLNANSQLYLSALTAHSSSVTTAPPISLPSEVEHQVSKAKLQIADASNTIGKMMTHDLPRDGRARRKLDNFVEMQGR